MIRIATVTFGGGVSTLGIDVVLNMVSARHDVEVIRFSGRVSQVQDADFIFVSLNWFQDVLDYCAFLKSFGVNPKRRKPVIIIGGIAASNTRLLSGLYHYAVLGDGEMVISDLIEATLDGDSVQLPGVVVDGDVSANTFLHNPVIPAFGYVEDRGNCTTRIEIARGCRYRCPFCQLGHTKRYREQPFEIVMQLVRQSKSKTVGLFAPDRSGYRRINELTIECTRIGKTNTAEDLRLDSVRKLSSVSRLKFGVEGFTEASRKSFRKVASNGALVESLRHIFEVLRKPNGKRHTTATMYMIGDLPGETPENAAEFWEVLREADAYCVPPFTLFLTLNSFSAKPFTPMARCGIHPYNNWATFWATRPHLKNITIAGRGGMLGPSNRITHMLTARGDERLTKLVFWLATDGRKLFRDSSLSAGLQLENLIRLQGVDPEYIYGDLDDSTPMPTDIYSVGL